MSLHTLPRPEAAPVNDNDGGVSLAGAGHAFAAEAEALAGFAASLETLRNAFDAIRVASEPFTKRHVEAQRALHAAGFARSEILNLIARTRAVSKLCLTSEGDG